MIDKLCIILISVVIFKSAEFKKEAKVARYQNIVITVENKSSPVYFKKFIPRAQIYSKLSCFCPIFRNIFQL